jgi:hypothetical protein
MTTLIIPSGTVLSGSNPLPENTFATVGTGRNHVGMGYSTCLTGSSSYDACIPWRTCAAGSTGPDGYCGSCLACSPGFFKSSTGNARCQGCPPGTTSAAGATGCTACTSGTFAQAVGTNVGTVATTCTTCVPNTYSNANGATAYAASYAGATSPVGSTSLDECLCGQG